MRLGRHKRKMRALEARAARHRLAQNRRLFKGCTRIPDDILLPLVKQMSDYIDEIILNDILRR